MRARGIGLSLLLLVSCAPASFAISQNDAALILKRMDSSIQSFRADFSLTESPTGATGFEIVQRGTYTQKGSDMFKIDFRFPHPQIALIRGRLVTIAAQDKPERVEKRLPDPPLSFLSRSISSLIRPTSLLPFLQLSVEGKVGKEWVVTGVPRAADAPFGRVQYFLSADSLLPVRRAVYNPKGRLTQVIAYQYERVGNIQVPSKVSALYPEPGGSKIIELRLENLQINRQLSDDEFVIPY